MKKPIPDTSPDAGQSVATADALREAQDRARRAEEELERYKRQNEANENGPNQNATKPSGTDRSGTNLSGRGERLTEGPGGAASSQGPGRAQGAEEGSGSAQGGGGTAELRRDPMMAHLLDSLDAGVDIGHYGRLVFAMVARHFLPADEVIERLTRDRDFSKEQAVAMVRQVESRDYSPPRRERILEWQREQAFPILPNTDDPDSGNLYRNLKFPPAVYEHIQEYQEEKAAS